MPTRSRLFHSLKLFFQFDRRGSFVRLRHAFRLGGKYTYHRLAFSAVLTFRIFHRAERLMIFFSIPATDANGRRSDGRIGPHKIAIGRAVRHPVSRRLDRMSSSS